MHVYVCMCISMEGRDGLQESVLSLCGSQGLNSGLSDMAASIYPLSFLLAQIK